MMYKSIYLVLIVAWLLSSCKNQEKDPNVLFIAIDDLRTTLGCYGAPQVKSPNIDQLANEAVVFKRAYCNIPVCGASRASLLTGILPTKTRFVDYLAKAEKEVPNAKTLPGVFRDAGYTCVSNGKVFHQSIDTKDKSWSEHPWMPNMSHRASFDSTSTKVIKKSGNGRVYEAPEVPDSLYPDYKTAQKVIRDLRRFKASGDSFFMACGFFRPHMPFYAPKKYWDLYDRDAIDLAHNRDRPENAPKLLRGSGEFKTYDWGEYTPETDDFHKMMRHGYYACISYVDQLVGEILHELEILGLADNTIVVLWGDHGWHLGEHEFWGKHNTMHNALQIPLIVKAPGKIKGKQTQALIESVDIYPTLCELAGLPVPDYVMGKSFVPVLDNPSVTIREAAYARFKVADAIVTQKFNYSLYENGEEMLYDLENDPKENKNLALESAYAQKLKELRNTLNKKKDLANSYK